MKRFLLAGLFTAFFAFDTRADVLVVEDSLAPGDVISQDFEAIDGELITITTWALSNPDLDTVLGVADGPDILAFDDDSGLNRGSRLFGSVSPGGTLTALVTGFPDFDFIGDHEEEGDYRLVITTEDTDTDLGGNDTIADAQALVGAGIGARVGGSLSEGDVDFYCFDLLAGSIFTAETFALDDIDTVLGLFNADGEELAFSDDEDGLASALLFEVLESGTYYIGVSGFPDVLFEGDHEEVGAYALVVSGIVGSTGVIPEPASLVMAGLGLIGFAAFARRRRLA